MRTTLTILILLLFTSMELRAQTPRDYIVTGGSYKQGLVSLTGNWKLAFKTADNSEPVVYSLDDVSEYGYDGESWEALVIESKREFYRRHVHGKVGLYELHGDYILKSGETLTRLNKKNFRSVISSIVKCEGSDPSLSKLRYNDSSIIGIITAFNDEGCNSDLIAYRKFGVTAGYNFISTSASTHVRISFKENVSAPSVGVFVDFPMRYKWPGLYLSLEAAGTSFQLNYYNQSADKTAFMALNATGVSTAVSFKFIRKRGNIKPYLKLGLLGSYLHLSSPTGLLTTETNGSTITITDEILGGPFKSQQLGYNAAVGLEIPIQRRKNFHFELRSNRSVPLDRSDLDFRLSNFSLIAGFNF